MEYILCLNLDTSIDYLKRWTAQFSAVKSFNWALLNDVPQWVQIENTYKNSLDKRAFTDKDSDVALFDQFGFLMKFLTDEKVQQWKQNKTPFDLRWVEIFKHFDKNNVAYQLLANMVQYGRTRLLFARYICFS